MLEDLPPESLWSAAGIGLFQLPMNTLAIAMGGHARVGLEDNIYHGFDRGELATNQGLVERVARPERDLRPPAGELGAGPRAARARASAARPRSAELAERVS